MLLILKKKKKQRQKRWVDLLCTLAGSYRKMHRGLYAIYSNSSEYSQEGRIWNNQPCSERSLCRKKYHWSLIRIFLYQLWTVANVKKSAVKMHSSHSIILSSPHLPNFWIIGLFKFHSSLVRISWKKAKKSCFSKVSP